MCRIIADYVPYQYSKAQFNSARFAIKNPDSSIVCRVSLAAFHVLLAIGCFFLDTFFTPCRWIYVLLTPSTRSPDSQNQRSSEQTGSIQQPSNPRSSLGAAEQIPPSELLTQIPLPSSISPLATTSTSMSSSTTSSSSSPASSDTGIGMPTWYRSTNTTGEEVFSLCRLPPLRFHKAPTFDMLNGRLNEREGQFSLFASTSPPLYKGIGDDFDFIPAIGFKCAALEDLLKSLNLSDGISDYVLNCSASAPVNLLQEMRQDYVLHEQATSYRFIYPIQLHPEKARRVVECLTQDQTVPSFIKGLMLIGGYAYYDREDRVVQVKSFSVNSQALEVLPTGKALNIQSIGYPTTLLKNFKTGIDITSGKGVWEGQKNLQSSHASIITAPVLSHLSHFAYIPQSRYDYCTQMKTAAPFGGFLYKTTNDEFQFVPIGNDFVPQVVAPQIGPALSAIEIEQNNKHRTLARMFYTSGSLIVSLVEIERLLPLHAVRRTLNGVELTLTGEGGVNYLICAINGQKRITIRKEGTQPSLRQEIAANIDEQGRISACTDSDLFVALVGEIYPHLMRNMLQVSSQLGRISTVRESIAAAPAAHLQAVVNIIHAGGDLCVNYLDIDERRYIVIDAGGVRRDYVSELFATLLQSSGLFRQLSEADESQAGLFQFKEEMVSLDLQNRTILQNIGIFFAWILNQQGAFPTGRGLSPEFFKNLYSCLSNITRLPKPALLNWYADQNATHADAIRALDQVQFPKILDTKISNYLAYGLSLSILEDIEDVKTYIETNWASIRIQAQTALAEQIKNQLAPYELIAERLRSSLRITIPSTPAALQESIEGQLDRAQVAAAITYSGYRSAIANKVLWIKGWILDPTTSLKEVENFIKAVTGSAALGSGRRIRVDEMAVATQQYYPVYHTCFCSMDMPFGQALDQNQGRHRTKELFLESFKEGLQQALASNGFTMA
jgi:hypothetical protein